MRKSETILPEANTYNAGNIPIYSNVKNISSVYEMWVKLCVISDSPTHTHAHMYKITHQRIYKTRDKFMQVYREMNYIMLVTFMYDLHITCMNIL